MKKKKIVVPETIEQYIAERSKKSPKFKKAYLAEITKLKIAYQIMKLRKQRHLSQAQLAKRIDTTQQTISRLEDPQNYQITITTLNKVAQALKARLKIDLKPKKI